MGGLYLQTFDIWAENSFGRMDICPDQLLKLQKLGGGRELRVFGNVGGGIISTNIRYLGGIVVLAHPKHMQSKIQSFCNGKIRGEVYEF